METTSGKETITVLRRLIAYAEKIFQLSKDIVTQVSDRREKPRISTAAVVTSSLVLFWGRLGSINAWEQVGRAHFWKRWLEEPTFSADTLGRVHAVLDAHGLRQGIHDVYERLKRNKALPDIYGLGVVVLDGHESHASYLRHCSGCLQRTIHTAGGDRLQFYHRQVTLMLLTGALPGREVVRLLLDHEPQRPGEEEVETALRLLARVISAYPRAFDRIVHLGHQRWDIENYGFNELANEWHSDHIFKHDSGAIECFLLVAFLAYNIFHVFLARNVKPAVRRGKAEIFWARLIAAELYSEVVPAGMSP